MVEPPAPRPPSAPTGWGIIIALMVFVGTFAGSAMGQTSIGFIGGLVVGALIALGLWLRDRR